VEGEALRGFPADTGKFLELVDEARHGFCESGHSGLKSAVG
jgi:hypothetical protein